MFNFFKRNKFELKMKIENISKPVFDGVNPFSKYNITVSYMLSDKNFIASDTIEDCVIKKILDDGLTQRDINKVFKNCKRRIKKMYINETFKKEKTTFFYTRR